MVLLLSTSLQLGDKQSRIVSYVVCCMGPSYGPLMNSAIGAALTGMDIRSVGLVQWMHGPINVFTSMKQRHSERHLQ